MTGHNVCPPGTVAGGWWKADGSRYCGGPRYYIDCNATCRCGGGRICPDNCSNAPWGCGCAKGDCNNRKAGCTAFRYGQCNQQVPTVGRIACRVVSCDAAVLVAGNCAPTVAVDNSTANHNKPCLQNVEIPEDDVEHGMAVDVVVNPADPNSGYTLDRWGGVHPFGAAEACEERRVLGRPRRRPPSRDHRLDQARGLRDGPGRRPACVRGQHEPFERRLLAGRQDHPHR